MMPRRIKLRLVQAALDKAAQLKREAEVQHRREDAFRATMGIVGDAAAVGIRKGRRVMTVNPTPHPSELGAQAATLSGG